MDRDEAANAVSGVWTRTLASYKKELRPKDLVVVEGMTSPTDLANHIKDLDTKRHAGKRGAFADRIHSITGRLTQFSSLIDNLTSSNTEASLIWGSLKLLLTIVHRSAEEYEKICESILAVSDSFPTVELLATTFDHSKLVCSHVVAFYESVLQFWSKALMFYRRRRVFNVLRAWHDFDSEFGDLDRDMKRLGQIIEKAAAAVHMNESRAARLEQTVVNRQLIEATQPTVTSDRHRDIAQWLAPINHEAKYFADDLRSAYESRHPGTCTWILERPKFEAWMNSDPNGTDATTRMLWLTGIPGAGKTVLSSFVINRCSEGSVPSTPTLYFFFKMTDSDKNSVLAVTRSLLYQLYLLFPAKLCTDIASLRDGSGKDKALSDQSLWDLFVKHAKDSDSLTIVLDALDECDGVGVLLGRVILLLRSCRARIFVVSRKEEIIAVALEEYPHIVITNEDIETDIRSYVTAEILKIPRFRGKSVQQRMIKALSLGHGGMLLWAYLMVKELKELGTVRHVDEALKALPTGLPEMHEAIIKRLDSTLHRAHRELATRILKWVVCAVRPLRLQELQDILRFEIRQGGSAGQSLDDDDLLYSEKDIELACGALVINRNETMQLIHLSTKEILMRRPQGMRPDDSRRDFYVDAQWENPHMAMICVSYMSTQLNGIDSIPRPNLENVSRLEFSKKSYDLADMVTKSSFIDYACISWQAHLIDGKIGLELESIMGSLQALLTYDLTVLWIEMCVLLHQDQDIMWTLERSCKAIVSWADYALVPAESSCHQAIGFLWAWSSAVISIINEYGPVVEEYPYEIHYLDLENVLSNECTPGLAALPLSFASTQGLTVREKISVIHAADKRHTKMKVEPCRQLQPNLLDPLENDRLGFVIYDNMRDVYFSAEKQDLNATEVLRVQERASGRRLQPIKSILNVFDVSWESEESPPPGYIELEAAILSPDGTYLAILYTDLHGYFVTSVWHIERHLDFLNIRDTRPWARRLHCLGTRHYSFRDSSLPLTVAEDGFLYCPSGKIHPDRGLHERFPLSLILTDRKEFGNVEVAFAGNGQTMIRLDRSIGLMEKIPWSDDAGKESLHLGMPIKPRDILKHRPCLRAISQTARFVVFEVPNEDPFISLFYLLDTMLDTRTSIGQFQVDKSVSWQNQGFHFSKDERYLLSIGRLEKNDTLLSRWVISESGVILEEENRLSILSGYMGNVCVAEDDSMIVLVDNDRAMYELDLESLDFRDGTLKTSMGSTFQHQLYCQRRYQVSGRGLGIVVFYTKCPALSDTATCDHGLEQPMSTAFPKTQTELIFVDLSGTADQMRTIELEYSDLHPSTSHEHVVTFSPDLSLLRAGLHIFDLSAPGHPQLSFPDSPLGNLQKRLDSGVSFSSCNGYLKIVSGEDPVPGGQKVTLQLFRICRSAGRIEKIVIANLEGLMADRILATFHPMLPLLMVTCYTHPESGVKDTAKAMKLMEIDLQALESNSIALPKLFKFPFRESFTKSEALFSDCGSFCFLRLDDAIGEFAILSSVLLERRQAKMQMPAVWNRETSYNGRLYEVRWDYLESWAPILRLRQAIDRPYRDGFRDGLNIHRRQETIVVNFTALPNHLGKDLIRILFLPEKGPPEIKYLQVTLNQILEKLAARSVEILRGGLNKREWHCEDWGSDMESEDAAVSADEDEQGYLGSGLEEGSVRDFMEVLFSADEDGWGNLEFD